MITNVLQTQRREDNTNDGFLEELKAIQDDKNVPKKECNYDDIEYILKKVLSGKVKKMVKAARTAVCGS